MSALVFFISVVVLVFLILLYRFRSITLAFEHLKENRGIKSALLVALAVFLISIAIGVSARDQKKLEYFKYVDVFLGLEWTDGRSLFCEPDDIDERGASNLGLRLNILEYGQFNADFKYTHHSGFICEDRNTYDAKGFELNYRFNIR